MGNISDPSNTVGRRMLSTFATDSGSTGEGYSITYTLRWRYMTASDNPEIWLMVDQDTGEVVATWFSDDPPPDDLPGLQHPDPTLRGRFSSIKLIATDLEAWSVLSAKAQDAEALIRDRGIKMQHAPMRALQLLSGDVAPAVWLAQNCVFDAATQSVRIERVDRSVIPSMRKKVPEPPFNGQ